MSAAELRDGVALAGVIPAPMVVIGTFVGYVGGGLWGALIVTAGVFAPSFAFTLFGHGVIERLVALRPLHGALDGVTAAVVGMIAATAVGMVAATAVSPLAWGVLSAAVVALFVSGRKWVTPAVVLGGAAVGLVFMR
jgi:chromate transporter